ncbi:N-formylglutamate amidohydrolase [Roseovarius tibetensis]|uniref:N-formylglutamate amidohydrolase n=1 Tax=Roseovarius tibetensis TaxID=2685897 RepID=UPI003D7F6D58
MTDEDWSAVRVTGAERPAPVVVVCEHAACHIPADLHDLGLDDAVRRSHVAWDIGAADMAHSLARALDAPLVEGTLSRLVYDCNRPLASPDCIPERSEVFDIPGNRGLDAQARQGRFLRVHEPFHAAVGQTCRAQTQRTGQPVALVTAHSFTPVYRGTPRSVEIGFLHHEDASLAWAALQAERDKGVYEVALNAPYSATDGVTYTLARHGDGEHRPALMIEVRNDLLPDAAAAERMGRHLADTVGRALGAAQTTRKAGE